jgi:hypothetical protein
MPRISAFYGIFIWMYHADHPPAHFHAQYGEHWAKIEIATGNVIEGSLPPRSLNRVRTWTELRRSELESDWHRAQRMEPLAPIDPLP